MRFCYNLRGQSQARAWARPSSSGPSRVFFLGASALAASRSNLDTTLIYICRGLVGSDATLLVANTFQTNFVSSSKHLCFFSTSRFLSLLLSRYLSVLMFLSRCICLPFFLSDPNAPTISGLLFCIIKT